MPKVHQHSNSINKPHVLNFHPVVRTGESWTVLDLSQGYDPDLITLKPPSLGRYNERRPNMYKAPHFKGERNIHMGLDFWVPADTPVFSFSEGRVLYLADNRREGDYGPTIVTVHNLDGTKIYALHGHLGRVSLEKVSEGQILSEGQPFACVGDPEENGGWLPHLHFQLALNDPGKADMPGVVSEKNHARALARYPDPLQLLGRIYE